MSRRPLIAGNWKLHKTVRESVALVEALVAGGLGKRDAEVAVAPVYTALHPVASALQGSGIALGAQNLHPDDTGAFTGEVSGLLLKDVGCDYVIVGHSERRQLFGDTDARIAARFSAALRHGLRPILCVGETLEERDASKTVEVVLGQLVAGLGEASAETAGSAVIAYEPVWAIGTGRTAQPNDAQAVHEKIREALTERGLGDLRVLYGGSVKPANAQELLAQPDIDGALVGGASLDPESFTAIVDAAS